MPAPNATGIHGSNRPAPASARSQAWSWEDSAGQKPNRRPNSRDDEPAGHAMPRGGQVPARLPLLPHSATAPDPQPVTRHETGTKCYRLQPVNALHTALPQRCAAPGAGSGLATDLLGKGIAQADGAVEHRT